MKKKIQLEIIRSNEIIHDIRITLSWEQAFIIDFACSIKKNETIYTNEESNTTSLDYNG